MAARAIVLSYPSAPPLANPRARIHIATPLNLKLHPSSSGLYTKLVPRKLALRPLASHVCPDGEVRPADSGDDEVDLPTEERIAETADSRGAELPIGIWQQVKDIVAFAAPAAGLWICGPMMSLIDTAVVGQSSSVELAALGPGTVVCDYMSYIFMFLSIATSNMVATSLAKRFLRFCIISFYMIILQDREEAQRHISMLLFVALASGLGMLFLMKFFGAQILSAFIGPKNLGIVPAANSYVQIRGLAWPAVLVGMVAQSASLAMRDSFGPLKVLVIASVVNTFGDVALCCFWHYGIVGAAWATMVSQFLAAFLMVESLNRTGFNAFLFSIPSPSELLQIFELAAPVFVTMFSKVAFYSLLTYFATSMGTITLAAHQVMIGVFCMCTVWGEPLSQTAQSFMPELIYGINRNLDKAKQLLQSLVIIGICTGLLLGTIGMMVPWLFPYLFTNDHNVVSEMQTVLLPYFVALVITPPTHSLEGTLLAGRDLKFLSLSMSSCFSFGSLLLLLVSYKGCGLLGCWWALSVFQWARFLLAGRRLTSSQSVVLSDRLSSENFSKLKAA